MRPFRSTSLTPEQQWIKLKSSAICQGKGRVHKGELVWEFDARPSPLSRIYRLRIQFKKGDYPNVLVVHPDLNVLADGRYLPHVYSTKPVKLCLHYPAAKEWTWADSIAETIVPWAYLWLLYFEHWLITDEWQGGGKHPGAE